LGVVVAVFFFSLRLSIAEDDTQDAANEGKQEAKDAPGVESSDEQTPESQPPASNELGTEASDQEDPEPPTAPTEESPRSGRSSTRDSSADTDQSLQDTPERSRDLRQNSRSASGDEGTDSSDTIRKRAQGKHDTRHQPNRNLGLSFSTDSDNRLRVGEIKTGSAFKSSGIRQGDVIVSVNGRRLRSSDEFNRYYSRSRTRFPVIVLRDGTEHTIYVEPMPADAGNRPTGGGYLGVMLDQRRRDAAVVRQVHPNSAAERGGMRAGDVIATVEGQEITAPDHLTEVIGGYAPGTQVRIETAQDDGSTQALMITLGSRSTGPVTGRPQTGVEVREGYSEEQAPSNQPSPAGIESSDDSPVIINDNRPPTRRERGGLRGRRNR